MTRPVVEDLEIRSNGFLKWLFILFTAMSLLAFAISVDDPGSNKWICLAGCIFFGSGFWTSARAVILADVQGLTKREAWKGIRIAWKDIHSLSYEAQYVGHGAQLVLWIRYGEPEKSNMIQVRRYKRKSMQRLFQVLDEQFPLALKNDHFVKMAAGTMNWKDKLRMY
jgi:hypothetical protein